MVEIRFKVTKNVGEKTVEKYFSKLGLTVTMKGVLKSLPENIHWHLKRGKEKGLLEITLVAAAREVIVASKKNRTGEWINEAVQCLRELMQS